MYCSKMRFFMMLVIMIGVFAQSIVKGQNNRCSAFEPCPPEGGETYRKVREISSSNGRLSFNLRVQMADVTFDWLTLKRRTYDGSIPGPTWRLRANDQVNVTLINNLILTDEEIPNMNELRLPNFTNLHTHGLHISGKVPSDNVFVNVIPQSSFMYQYQLAAQQPAGTYWYHAHFHGSVVFQVDSGLGGMIIIEDPTIGDFRMPDHLAEISCPDNCQHEIPLYFHPTLRYAAFSEIQEIIDDNVAFRNMEETIDNIPLAEWLKENVDHYTTNGILFPVLSFNTGQRKRFRMVNGGAESFLIVTITKRNRETATTDCEVWEIALDGIYLDRARRPRSARTLLPPGSRAEWIVVCKRPGIYELKSVAISSENCSLGIEESLRFTGLLATLRITGMESIITPQNTMLPIRPHFVSDFRNVNSNELSDRRYTVELNSNFNLNRDRFSGKENFRYKMELGKVQEWYLTNTDPTSGHPLHIHVNSFQVISYNPYHGPVSIGSANGVDNVFYSIGGHLCHFQSVAYCSDGVERSKNVLTRVHANASVCPPNHYVDHAEEANREESRGIGYAEIGEFRDVIVVPPLSNITIRFLTDEFDGEVVIHCHILFHEDSGMMMVVDIVQPGEDLIANEMSGNAFPGQCSSGNSLKSTTSLNGIFTALLLVVIAGT